MLYNLITVPLQELLEQGNRQHRAVLEIAALNFEFRVFLLLYLLPYNFKELNLNLDSNLSFFYNQVAYYGG